MDYGILISSIMGSVGLFSLTQFLINRHDNKNSRLIRIDSKLDNIEKRCKRNELAITRLQLLFLIENQPENEDAIESTAHRYFVELHGNAEAWMPFYHWASAHHVDTDWYKNLLRKEK